ncbi:antileukoproteinase isoform X2 [Cavia porcellus]|uniref:antileukoproteinase isoform X2 n=1 Tax=Cavia porcellus TaxID=10141 RepID=UPI000661ABC1|nr:antileukoproteinase isoform X2 [Cavia porcellus]
MQSKSLLFFVVCLALGALEALAAEGYGKSVKAGACPARNHVLCVRYERPECNSDWQCPGKKRCCPDFCNRKCLDPVVISKSERKKPGKCPVVIAQCLMLNPPNFCEKDSQCEGNLKCCKSMCGKACVPPE